MLWKIYEISRPNLIIMRDHWPWMLYEIQLINLKRWSAWTLIFVSFFSLSFVTCFFPFIFQKIILNIFNIYHYIGFNFKGMKTFQRKLKWQWRMANPDKLAPLGTENTRRRQIKQKTTQKPQKTSNTNPTRNRRRNQTHEEQAARGSHNKPAMLLI